MITMALACFDLPICEIKYLNYSSNLFFFHSRNTGGDYQKKISIRNVGTEVVKFRYKLPATQFFFMEYPELIVLSPGLATSIAINFRPVHKVLLRFTFHI